LADTAGMPEQHPTRKTASAAELREQRKAQEAVREAERAAQQRALHVVERWNAERSPLWSPTIRCAIVAGTPWLDGSRRDQPSWPVRGKRQASLDIEKNEGGRPRKNRDHDDPSFPTAKELGFSTKTHRLRWELIGRLPENLYQDHVHNILASTDRTDKTLTVASTLAAARRPIDCDCVTFGLYAVGWPGPRPVGAFDFARAFAAHFPLTRACARCGVAEAGHLILTRPLKGCTALKSWAMRIAKRAGMKKAAVALARKLAVIMHRMLADGTPFTTQPA
jgi:hypothetical protein